ncbi:MAG: hypothetical protein ABSD67_26080 [Terracidiphilus sp.]|jgi:hypothetical protein
MQIPEAHNLSKHFTHLVGRDVKFQKAGLAPDKGASWIYGSYEIVSVDDPTATKSVVVKADRDLLGSIAGALVGLPSDEVVRRLRSAALDELLQDAIYEILNVAAGVIAPGHRTILTAMSVEARDVQGEAAKVLATPSVKAIFDVVVQGYSGGRFRVFG